MTKQTDAMETSFLAGMSMHEIALIYDVPVEVVEEAIRQAKRDRDAAKK